LPGNAIVTINKNATSASATITAEENILPYIESLTEKEELLVRFKRDARIGKVKEISIKVILPAINSLKILGNGNAELINANETNPVILALMGNGNIITQNCIFNKLSTDLTGNGNFQLLNTACNSAEYALKGNGSIEASNNTADSVKAIVVGNGSIDCKPIKYLDAEVNGNGSIHYSGTPNNINKKIGGNGTVQQK
jgi:hypothetical protein